MEDDLEKVILIAEGNNEFAVFVGTERDWVERELPKEKIALFNYVKGLLDGSNVRINTIKNGPDPDSQWFYAGKPIDPELFKQLLAYVKEENNRDNWA